MNQPSSIQCKNTILLTYWDGKSVLEEPSLGKDLPNPMGQQSNQQPNGQEEVLLDQRLFLRRVAPAPAPGSATFAGLKDMDGYPM